MNAEILTYQPIKSIAVIYHDQDWDGILSREVCLFHLKQHYPDAFLDTFGWDYGRPVPDVDWNTYEQIYIVDLSVDELMARPELKDKIVWIDHHKSAIEKWGDKGLKGLWIDGVAACRLCWQYFLDGGAASKEQYIRREVSEPELIRLAGEFDIWDHRDPRTKPLQFGLRALDEDTFLNFVRNQFKGNNFPIVNLQKVVELGEQIKSYTDKVSFEHAKACSHTVKWEGLTFCALNIGQKGNSDLLLGGLKPEHEACFAWRYDGKGVTVSLYHTPTNKEPDLSKIAVKYGGGGHKGACGFKLTLTQLDKILNPT